MRIQQISVNGLFGIFDHVISLNVDERITIIHGPNVFGKTAILRMLNGSIPIMKISNNTYASMPLR